MSKIISISEAAGIGFHAMTLIAQNGPMNVQQISDKTHESKHHIAKVLQRLVKAELLSSNRGPTGGFAMKKDPAEITLMDIYESIEGRIDICTCPLEHDTCAFERCLMNNITQMMTLQVIKFFKEKKLSEYIKGGMQV